MGCTLLELYESTSSLKLSDSFAADQRKRIEAADTKAKAGAGAEAGTGAVKFGTGIEQVEEVLNALLQVDPASRLTAQAVYDKPYSFFANPPIDSRKPAHIPSECALSQAPLWFRRCCLCLRLHSVFFSYSLDICRSLLHPQSASAGHSCSRT
jgi:hypothetical protein